MANEGSRLVEKIWLIKSSNKILGPYSTSEVKEQLINQELSILDEIRNPKKSWIFIREIAEFAEVVKQVRDFQQKSSENTVISSSQRQMETRTDVPLDELQKSESDLSPSSSLDIAFKDISVSSEKKLEQNNFRRPVFSANNYGFPLDVRVQGRRKWLKKMRGLIASISVILVLAILILMWHRSRQKEADNEALLNQALKYKSWGLNQKSLLAYNKASTHRQPHLSIKSQIAPIMVSEGHASLEGRRILENALRLEGLSSEKIIEDYLGIAVSHMVEGSLSESDIFLQKALSYEAWNPMSQLNLAILQFKRGQYSTAKKTFGEIYQRDAKLMMALYGWALAAVESAKTEIESNDLDLIIGEIKKKMTETPYFRQQLGLLLVYLENLQGNSNGVNQSVVQFLNIELGFSGQFNLPVPLDWQFFGWKTLEKYCSEMYEKSMQTAEMKALRAVCLKETNHDMEAQQILQQALLESPKDPYILAVEAAFLKKEGRYPEALALLKMSELKPLKIKDHMLAEICEANQDADCVELILGLLYKENPKDLETLYGLSWAHFKKQKKSEAFKFLNEGLAVDSHYLPLIELAEQMGSMQ